jgi:hypothetical protein
MWRQMLLATPVSDTGPSIITQTTSIPRFTQCLYNGDIYWSDETNLSRHRCRLSRLKDIIVAGKSSFDVLLTCCSRWLKPQNSHALIRSNGDGLIESALDPADLVLSNSSCITTLCQSIIARAKTQFAILHAVTWIGHCTVSLILRHLISRQPQRTTLRDGTIVLDLLGLFGLMCIRQLVLCVICPMLLFPAVFWVLR